MNDAMLSAMVGATLRVGAKITLSQAHSTTWRKAAKGAELRADVRTYAARVAAEIRQPVEIFAADGAMLDAVGLA